MISPLTISALSKTYTIKNERVKALRHIDLTLNEDEFVCLIGPNGCGKSTLLKIIAGILKPTSGNIKLNEAYSYLPQDDSLLPWRTVRDNLFLPADVKNIARKNVQSRIDILLKEFGLSEFKDFYPASLSGGQKKKLAIARTIVGNGSFLLLDEPFAPLDALTRLDHQRWLRALCKKRHLSVLMVTHDIHEAISLADTIYVISARPGAIRERFKVTADNKPKLQKVLMNLLMTSKE